jgi:uncharacterized protein
MASLTDTLCTRCGLCCDGSLFADVELAGRAEATRLEILGLEIEDGDSGGALLVQPCAALHKRRCAIYEHRPRCCRTFECRLLQNVRRGAVSVGQAQEQIAATLKAIACAEALLVQLGRPERNLPLQERCDEALSETTGHSPDQNRERAELAAAISEVRRMVRLTFIGAGTAR